MTSTQSHAATVLRRAAVRATRAPSVHNTQPWRFVIGPGRLEVHADWSRQLRVLDPRGRQLLMSSGCALLNARVSLAAAGVTVTVERFAPHARDSLVARLLVDTAPLAPAVPDGELAHLDAAIETRQTNRREFTDQSVAPEVLARLHEAARAEECSLVPVVTAEHRAALARLSRIADRSENADPFYRAELRRWTSSDPGRPDGVPWFAVPHVDGTSREEVPLRDFDTHGAGWLPARTASTADQCLLLLGSDTDDPLAWLRAGEALERVLLEITRGGYAVSPLTQVIEVPHTHAALREQLGLRMHPYIVLRVGRAPSTPATRRRRLVDVIVEEPAGGPRRAELARPAAGA